MKRQGIHIKTAACGLIGNTILKKVHCLTRKGALAPVDGTTQPVAVLAR